MNTGTLKVLRFIRMAGFRNVVSTLIFNIRILPLREALHFPVLITHNVNYRYTKRGTIHFENALRFGVISFGYSDRQYSYNRPSFLKIQGELIIRGRGFHVFANGTTLEIGKDATCVIGDDFSVSHNNRIRIMKSLTVGSNNMWSFDNVIMDTDAHHLFDENGVFYNHNEGVSFGDNVWVGCRNIILKGASIPNNCVVASGSTINKKYSEENCIISSFGKVLKRGITWDRKLT